MAILVLDILSFVLQCLGVLFLILLALRMSPQDFAVRLGLLKKKQGRDTELHVSPELYLQEVEAERQRRLEAARAEVDAILEKAEDDAKERQHVMIETAKREVQRVILDGRQRLEEDRAAMLKEARREMVDIAMRAAAKIVNDGLTEHKARSFAEEIVRKFT